MLVRSRIRNRVIADLGKFRGLPEQWFYSTLYPTDAAALGGRLTLRCGYTAPEMVVTPIGPWFTVISGIAAV